MPVGSPARREHLVSGVGWGGQRLFLVPALDLAVAINAGNCGKPGLEQRRISNILLTDLVLPVLA